MPAAGLVNLPPRRYRAGGYVRRLQGGGPAGAGGPPPAAEPGPPPDTSLHFIGYPPGFATLGGGGGMTPGGPGGPGGGGPPGGMDLFAAAQAAPYQEGAPWGLTQQDLESPLAYTRGDWQPRETGGFFTLRQLYGGLPGGPTVGGVGPSGPGGPPVAQRRGQDVPGSMYYGADLPSTNNWRLLGLGPGKIMRNGFIIDVNSPYTTQGYSAGGYGRWADYGGGSAPVTGVYSPHLGAQGGLPASWGGYGISAFWPGAYGEISTVGSLLKD